MGRSKLFWGLVLVCGPPCILLSSCDPSAGQELKAAHEMNLALSERHLPELPTGVTDAHCWVGGAFAKYMNVKFTASADQALDYLRRADTPCHFEFQGDGTEYRVVATHALPAAPETSPETQCEKGFFLLTEKGIQAEPWFKTVYDIRHGWYYYWADWPARYHVYYDLDSRQFYIYWMYS